MEIVGNVVWVRPFVTLTIAIIVLFVGKDLNQRFAWLRRFYISESVSGGLLMSIVLAVIYLALRIEVQFDLTGRQYLLVYFFTAIGINTKWRALVAARLALAMLLATTIAYIALQDFIAVSVARALGGVGPEALLAGSVALAGGSETTIAWAPTFVADFGIADARQIGIASATFGLILGSLAGGPIARHLIRRRGLQPQAVDGPGGALAHGNVDDLGFLQSILAIHICVVFGFGLHQLFADRGFALPLPAVCFLVAIVLTNLIPTVLPKVRWPSRTPAMSLIAELSLGILFGMSLISARLWVILDLPPQLLIVILVQLAAMVVIAVLVVFQIMGRDHDAAVICSGFAGFALGSTSTGMANMKAVARDSGSLHMAFIVVPLVAVLSIDAVNGVLIGLFLAWF